MTASSVRPVGSIPVLPPALPGDEFELDDPRAGRVHGYATEDAAVLEKTPLLLVHSVNAAASAFEVRPVYEHQKALRPTYALDLPGFGLSERSDRVYSARLMTDAIHAVTREIRRRRGGGPIDALALSTGCELFARAASEDRASYRRIALVSPTGFSGKTRRMGPPGASRAIPGLHAFLSFPLWADALFGLLTRPKSVRYFLERTWGGKNIDEGLWAYDVLTARQPGAKYAPFYFVAGNLFSKDINAIYDSLEMPVWMSHGVRGDFVDYRGAAVMRARSNWQFDTFDTGALPYFEVPDAFHGRCDAFFDISAGERN